MIQERELTRARALVLPIPGVVGLGYGLKVAGGEVTQLLAWRVYVHAKRPLRQVGAVERIPAFIGGLCTDVIEHAPASPSSGSALPQAQPGAKIANARGVPGTFGCIARTVHDNQRVLLSNWHVLFGRGANEDDPVWLVDETGTRRRFFEVGKTLYGKIGTVRVSGEDFYVDCAISSCVPPSDADGQPGWPFRRAHVRLTRVHGQHAVGPGAPVKKTGAATGTTEGIVVDVSYPDVAWVEGRAYPAPRQLLVRPVDGQPVFSAEGDSGSVVTNAAHNAVGLLWATNSRGEGVACPIGPVCHALNISLDAMPGLGLRERLARFARMLRNL